MHGIWITWNSQRRNIGLSAAFGYPLYEVLFDTFPLQRYLKSTLKTISIIANKRPKVVVAQNPSIILSTLVLILRFFLNYRVIIDAHNGGLFPLEGKSKVLMKWSKLIQNYADLTLVTNETLKLVVEGNKGKAFVLPDRLPDITNRGHFDLEGRFKVAFICTYSSDEPYEAVIQSAHLLPQNVSIYLTGKYDKKIDPDTIPPTVKPLGFIPEEEYWSFLSASDLVMVLTKRQACLVCGAYEGVALSKPLILSDTKALRSYFNSGCVYVQPTPASIASGIETAMENYDTLTDEIKSLKPRLRADWKRKFKSLEQFVAVMANTTSQAKNHPDCRS